VLTARSGGRRLRSDDGSSLMLMPAAVLIVIVLGAMAADLSQVHNARRGLVGVADSVANDAVTYGLDTASLRRGTVTDYPFDDARVRQAVERSLAVHRSPTRRYRLVGYTTDRATRTVTVTLAARVEWIFAKALPGVGDDAEIAATGTAVAEPS
jgi:hypothetical protein